MSMKWMVSAVLVNVYVPRLGQELGAMKRSALVACTLTWVCRSLSCSKDVRSEPTVSVVTAGGPPFGGFAKSAR